MTSTVRPAAVAGSFYPAASDELSRTVTRLLDAVQVAAGKNPSLRPPKVLVVPHAGYIYSGATAAQAYALLKPWRNAIDRVVLLGPTHRFAVRGLALPGATAFATPLGEVPMDPLAVALLAGLPQVVVSAAAHAQEHSLEVQLPFLQTVLERFTLVPLAVGDASATEVAQVLERLWGDARTLIVISTDLSHFLSYDTARTTDRNSLQALLNLAGPLTHTQACGATGLNGLMLVAKKHGMTPELLGWCNSGDTAGDRNRVVGYAALRLMEPAPNSEKTTSPDTGTLPADAGRWLLPLARAAIADALGRPSSVTTTAPPPTPADALWQQAPGASFVTLTQEGRLRGCIGSLQAVRSLREDVISNAVAAALRDPRFEPLSAAELERTAVEVSVLTPPEPLQFVSEADALAQLRPGVDGVILSRGRHRSTFLPQVWEQLPDAKLFMEQLKRKAGLAADFWSDEVQLSRYAVSKWKETGRAQAATEAAPKVSA